MADRDDEPPSPPRSTLKLPGIDIKGLQESQTLRSSSRSSRGSLVLSDASLPLPAIRPSPRTSVIRDDTLSPQSPISTGIGTLSRSSAGRSSKDGDQTLSPPPPSGQLSTSWRKSLTLPAPPGSMIQQQRPTEPQRDASPIATRGRSVSVSVEQGEKPRERRKERREDRESMTVLPPIDPVPESDASRAVKSEILSHISAYNDRLISDEVKNDAHKYPDLFTPLDAVITVHSVPREHRTMQPSVTAEMFNGVEPHVAAALNAFIKDWMVVKWPEVAAVKAKEPKEPVAKPVTGDLDERLLAPVNSELRRNITAARREDREPIMCAANIQVRHTASLPLISTLRITQQRRTARVLVRFQSLAFTTGNLEPLFASATLYNLLTAERLSESFYFDLNEGPASELIRARMQEADAESRARAFIATLPSATPDAVLIIRVERILRGEDSPQALEPYLHEDKMKAKDKEKLLAEIDYATARLGRYNQPIAYTIISLFDEHGTLRSNGKLEVKQFKKWKYYHTEVYICDKESERRKEKVDDSTRRFLPLTVKLTARQVLEGEQVSGILDTTLNPVKPPTTNAAEFVKELQPFFEQTNIVAPHSSYVNTLYVYPQTLRLSKLKDSSGRNISIRIKLMEHDDDAEAAGLPVIYARSSSKNFVREWHSSVSYHNPTPVWNEEVKIRLPPRLTPSLHLLLSFYHISCKTKDKKLQSSDVDEPPQLIGHSVLPLLSVDPDTLRLSNRVLADEVNHLPIATILPPGYLNPSNEHVKWLESKRNLLFEVRTKGVTSIFSHSELLNTFWIKWQTSHDNAEFVTAIRALQNVPPRLLVSFFPLLLDQLFAVLTNRAEDAAREATWSILHIIECVTEIIPSQQPRHPLLLQFVDQQLDLNCSGTRLAHEELLRFLIAAFTEGGSKGSLVMRHSWFFLQVLLKSMALSLARSGKLSSSLDQRKSEFGAAFTDQLKRLFVSHLIPETVTPRLLPASRAGVAKSLLNDSIASALRCLLSLVDRTIVIEILYRHVAFLNSCNQAMLKLHLLENVCSVPHFTYLDLPVHVKIVSIGSLVSDFWRTHLFSGLLINEIFLTLMHADDVAKEYGLDLVCRLLARIEVDPRLSDRAAMERAASSFFPFLVRSIEQVELLRSSPRSVLIHWLLILLWILRHCSRRNLLRDWWRQETPRCHMCLLSILLLMTETFSCASNALLAQETTLVCLDVLEDFTWDFRQDVLPPSLLSSSSKASLSTTSLPDLKPDDSELTDLLDLTHEVLLALLQREQTQRSIVELFWFLVVHVRDFRRLLFLHRNPQYCGDLADDLLRYMNSSFHDIRAKASAVYFLLVRTNFELTNDCARIKLQSTIAMSRIAGSEVSNYSFLETSLKAVAQRATMDPPKARENAGKTLPSDVLTPLPVLPPPPAPLPAPLPPTSLPPPVPPPRSSPPSSLHPLPPPDLLPLSLLSSFMPQLAKKRSIKLARSTTTKKKIATAFPHKVQVLTRGLRQIIEDSIRLDAAKYDPELTADLYHEIAASYIDSPDLRITWLENLAALHYTNKSFEEAAFCKLLIAYLIGSFLKNDPEHAHLITPKVTEAFVSISPNLASEPRLPDVSLRAEGIFQPKTFSMQGLLTSLRQAVQMFKQGQVYELAIDVYHVIAELLAGNYLKLAPVYLDMRNLATTLSEAAFKQNRSFGSFFKVSFYGNLRELDRKTFIYKTFESQAELIERLKKQFSIKSESVQVLEESWNREEGLASLACDCLYIHVVPVRGHWDRALEDQRFTPFDRTHNVNCFTTDISAHTNDCSNILKTPHRAMLLTTSASFPFSKRRLQVTERKESMLSPLDSCMSRLQDGTFHLRMELAADVVNPKALHSLLQQHLLQNSTFVVDVAQEFLVNAPAPFPPDVQHRLLECISLHVQSLGAAVVKHNSILGPSQLDFQTLCEAAIVDVRRGLKNRLPEEHFQKLVLN